jgi:hypothetical protein
MCSLKAMTTLRIRIDTCTWDLGRVEGKVGMEISTYSSFVVPWISSIAYARVLL